MSTSKVTLAVLQDRFLAGMDRRLAQLSSGLSSLRDVTVGAATSAIIDELMRGFHSIAGIGGTYGYAEITDLASIGEILCGSLSRDATTAELMELSEIIDRLALSVEAARNGSPALGTSSGSYKNDPALAGLLKKNP